MAGDDSEIQVSLTADASDLDAGMQEGADSVASGAQTMAEAIAESSNAMQAAQQKMIESTAAEATAFNQAVQGKISAQSRLQAAFAGNLASTAGVAEAEGALDQAMTAGAITAGEYSAFIERLTTAEAEVAVSSEAATVAVEENTAAMVINGGVARELGVLLGELARGNYTRLEGSSITLANRTGLLQQAFTPMGAAAIAAGVAVAGFGYEMLKGEEAQNAFAKAVINSGGSLNLQEDQFNKLKASLVDSETTIGTAGEVLLKLAQSGRFTADNLHDAGQAAVDFAALTGKSMDEAVAAIIKIEEDPVKALRTLNDEYHFLSLAELDHIQKLQDEGDKTGAASAAIEAFAQVNKTRLAEADQDVGTLVKAWRGLKAVISDVFQGIQDIGKTDTDEQKLAALKAQKEAMQQQFEMTEAEKIAYAEAGGVLADTSAIDYTNINNQIAAQEKLIQAKKDTANAAEQSQKIQDAGLDAAKQSDEVLKGMKSVDAYNDALKNELALLKQIHEANANDERVKDITFDDGGNASGGDGLAKIETYLKKKYDAKQKAGESEHKLDEDQLAQEEADEGIGYSDRLQFEMAFWQKKLESATQGTKEYAQAYAKVQGLEKQYDEESAREADKAAKEKLHSQLSALDQARAAYDGDNENQKQQYQQQYEEGKISASQLAALEKDLVEKKLAADTAYLTAKENLDRAAGASGVDAANAEATQIVKIKEKADKDLQTIDDQAIKNGEKDWNGYASAIGSSFKSAITGMLFQGNTFKQGMASIGESIVGTFVDKTVDKMVQSWITGEAAKTAATVAGNTARSTAQASAAVASKTLQDTINGSEIQADAATGAAGAYKAVVGIPIVGPVLAPVAAAVAYGGILAYKSIASAAGGWGDVDSDQVAMIHKNEMILPANIAQGVREMTSGGVGGGQQGGGDTHNWYIQTMDGRTTEQFFRNNMGVLAKAVKQKTTNNPQARR